MVTAKPWKLHAIVRLVLSVFLCMFAGSLVLNALHYAQSHKRMNPWFWLLVAAALGLLGWALVLLRKQPTATKGTELSDGEGWATGNNGVPLASGLGGEGPTFSGEIARHWSRHGSEPLDLRRVLLIAIAYYAGMILSFWAENYAGPLPEVMSASQIIIGGLSLQGAALVLLVFFVREHGLTFSKAFGFCNRLGKALLAGVVAATLILPVALTLLMASARLMEHFHLQPKPQSAVEALGIDTSLGYRISLGVYAILLAPAAEEMLFRGVLYPAIKQAGYPRLAWVGTALLFAAIHLNLPSFVPLFVLALVLTLLYEMTNNLASSITAHALFNIMNFLLFYRLH